MKNNFNLLNINYYISAIDNSDKNILISNLDNYSSLEIVKGLIYNYLINSENILILSNSLNSNLLIEEVFEKFDFMTLDLQSKYDFKEKITNLLNLRNIPNKNYISKIELVNRTINKKLDTLIEVNSLFSDTTKNNMSLLEKYIKTEEAIKYDTSFNKAFKIFKDNNRLSKYKNSHLKYACNSILASNISEDYIKYRRLVDNNIFNFLITPVDYNKLEINLSKLEEVINNVDKYRLIHSEYSKEFFDELFSNNNINEEHILSISNLINFKYNYILLNKKKNKRWFNFFSKHSTLDDENNLSVYHNSGERIYKEYIYNFQTIKDLNSDLLFLKNTLKEEKYNEIIKSLIKDNSLKESLLFCKSLLSIAKNTKNTFEMINKLSNTEKDILNYCYDYCKKKEDVDSLVKLIPDVRIYLEIEEEEAEKLNVIKLCSKYDALLNDINNEVDKRNSLILNYINDLWLYILEEKYEIFKNNIDDKNFKYSFPCVVSNFTNESINKVIEEKCFFKKVIILFDNNNDFTDFEKLNIISEKIILLSNENIDLVNINKIDSSSINKLNIANDYSKIVYREIEGYLRAKCNIDRVIIYNNYMEIYNKDIKLFIKVSPMNYYDATSDVYEDIYLSRLCKSNNNKFYRVWYRNWWLDKFKVLKSIVRVLSQ